jgi:biopolymer transport protein ExbB
MLEIFRSGGPLMYVILLLAILGLAVVFDRLFYLMTKESENVEAIKEELIKAIKEDNIKGAIELCGTHKSSASKVLKGVLKEVYYDDEAEVSLLEEKAREIALEELPKLEKNMWLLSMAAQLSPLVGLLGTVTGMIMSFNIISQSGTGDPKALAGGIAQALITTAAGLIVAVPSVFSYNFLNKKIDNVLNSIEKSSVELINVIRKR